jgi:hypothetical protein
MSRLALGAAALAQTGQLLSAIATAEQARASLLKAANNLESDSRLAGIHEIAALSEQCRSTASLVSDDEVVPGCRRIAAALARKATDLAKEIQEQVRRGPEAERPAAPAPAPVPAPASPLPTPMSPTPAFAPSASPAPKPRTPAVEIERITIARTDEERGAVAAALERGARFAVPGARTVIDVRTNMMWISMASGVSQAEAEPIARAFQPGGYGDWRLPTESELSRVLSEGGPPLVESLGLGRDALVWVAAQRFRWIRLRSEGRIINVTSREAAWRAARDATVRAVLVRP